MNRETPHDSILCHFCNGGCFCPIGTHSILSKEPGKTFKTDDQIKASFADCVSCDVCEGTGELSERQVEEMAEDYKADEQWSSRHE